MLNFRIIINTIQRVNSRFPSQLVKKHVYHMDPGKKYKLPPQFLGPTNKQHTY